MDYWTEAERELMKATDIHRGETNVSAALVMGSTQGMFAAGIRVAYNHPEWARAFFYELMESRFSSPLSRQVIIAGLDGELDQVVRALPMEELDE